MLALAITALVVAFASPVLTPGQVDDFQDGGIAGWAGGHPASPPANIATGGPAGAGDRYLQITGSGGFGAGSKLGTWNGTQWAGDYIAAGITAIEADFRKVGGSPVQLRLLMPFGDGGEFTSVSTVTVPADGQWHHRSFSLNEADLVFVGLGGTGVAADTLTSCIRVLFRHQPGPPEGSGGAPGFSGQLCIDNITAIGPPEIPAIGLVGQLAAATLSLIAGVVVLRRRRSNPVTPENS